MIFQDYKIDVLDRGVRLPEFRIDKCHLDYYQLEDDCSCGQFLYVLCIEGLRKRGITTKHPRYADYISRMREELSAFSELGFESYLLLTWDLIRFCREEGDVAVGRGRGSCAGSLVLWLIEVTQIDSLKNGLFFERFLSKTRAKFKVIDGVKYYEGSMLMDIDLDIAHNQRGSVLAYIEKRYHGQVSKLLTVSTFTTKVLVKEVAKAIIDNFQEKDAKLVSDMVPVLHGKVYSIVKTMEESSDFKDFMVKNPKVYRVCRKLEGLIKHTGLHASAVGVSFQALETIIPTQRAVDKETGPLKVTAYEMADTSDLIIKVDILGLECVTLINETCKKIGIKPFDLDVEHPVVFEALQDFKSPYGCFQISDNLGYMTAKRIKPKNIYDLSAVLALSRPGSLQFTPQYQKFVETGEIQSVHPFLDKILRPFAGLCLYQENLMAIIKEIGFTLLDAEDLRKVVGKKLVDKSLEWKQRIADKIKENGLPAELSDIIWKIVQESAHYSFNFCNSLDTMVDTESGYKMMAEIKKGERIRAYDVDNDKDHFVEVINIWESEAELYEVELDDGRKIRSSLNHKYLTEGNKLIPLWEILEKNLKILTE